MAETNRMQEEVTGMETMTEAMQGRDADGAAPAVTENAEHSESEAERVTRAFEAYRRETERENLKRERMEAVKKALRGAGVKREEFVALLTENLTLRGAWEQEGFDAGKITQEARERYGACFCETGVQGIGTIAPPVQGADTMEDDMLSDEEYYRRRWKGGRGA